MNALTKFSITLLPVTATEIAVYLYATSRRRFRRCAI
jgi:hypothetical protein